MVDVPLQKRLGNSVLPSWLTLQRLGLHTTIVASPQLPPQSFKAKTTNAARSGEMVKGKARKLT